MSQHSSLQTAIDEVNRLITKFPSQLPQKVFGIDLGDGYTFVLDGTQDTLTRRELPKGGCDCLITTDPKSLETLLTNASAAGHLVWMGKIKITNLKSAMELALALQKLRGKKTSA